MRLCGFCNDITNVKYSGWLYRFRKGVFYARTLKNFKCWWVYVSYSSFSERRVGPDRGIRVPSGNVSTWVVEKNLQNQEIKEKLLKKCEIFFFFWGEKFFWSEFLLLVLNSICFLWRLGWCWYFRMLVADRWGSLSVSQGL